ncbi:MAG: AbrB family transcriptional regulator [Phycisphaerae bacterium]
MSSISDDQAVSAETPPLPSAMPVGAKSRWWNSWLLLPLGVAGGVGGYYAGIPSGWMIGAVLVVIAAKLLGLRPARSQRLYGDAGSILLGTFAGALFGPETLTQLGQLLVPALGVIVGLVILGLLAGLLLAKAAKIDLATCFYGLTPGGLSEMVAASRSSTADSNVVLTLQLLRFYTVVLMAIVVLRWLPL